MVAMSRYEYTIQHHFFLNALIVAMQLACMGLLATIIPDPRRYSYIAI